MSLQAKDGFPDGEFDDFDPQDTLSEVQETAPTPQTKVDVYSSNHLIINGVAYEVDDVTQIFVRELSRARGPIDRTTLMQNCFKGSTGISPAQMARFGQSINTLSGIEEDLGIDLFELYIEVDDEEETVFVNPHLRTIYHKRPFELPEEENVDELQEKVVDEKEVLIPAPELLSDLQRQIIEVVCRGGLFDPETEEKVLKKKLFQSIFGNDTLNTDQQFQFNRAVTTLNEWLPKNGINLSLTPTISRLGPVLEISNVFYIETLMQEIKEIEDILNAKHEEEVAREKAIRQAADTAAREEEERKRVELEAWINDDKPTKKGSTTKVQKPKSVTKRTKEISKKPPQSPLGTPIRNARISKHVGYRDVETARQISLIAGMDHSGVIATRICIGRALGGGKLPSGHEQEGIIALIQRGQELLVDNSNLDITLRRDLSKWVEASIGVMVARYQQPIGAHALKLSGGNFAWVDELKAAGLRGLMDGIARFDPNTRTDGEGMTEEDQTDTKDSDQRGIRPKVRNSIAYLGSRIYGEMVDTIRSSSFGGRNHHDEFTFYSIDRAEEDQTEDDRVSILAVVEKAKVPSRQGSPEEEFGLELLMRRVVTDFRENRFAEGTRGEHGEIKEHHLQVLIYYFGITNVMTVEERSIYDQYAVEGERGIDSNKIAQILGVTESRISQIRTATLGKLRAQIGYYERDLREFLG